MSRRWTGQAGRERPVRNIQGPQSALTDFLATHNISAQQIRDDFETRARQAQAQNQDTNGHGNAEGASANPSDDQGEDAEAAPTSTRRGRPRRNETDAQEEKRKAKEKQAIEKIKASKAFKKRARLDDVPDDELDEMARQMYSEKSVRLPGQMDNCELCDKRFTVTPYSRSGPNGGLLCAECSRKVDKDDKDGEGPKKKKARKSTGGIGRRRNVQSSMMDGTYHRGAKNLMRLCIETLAKNVHLADDLGDLPIHVEDKIARLFSKRRLLKPTTLSLFVRPSTEILSIYTAAYLSSDDLLSVFQTCSKLKELKVRDAIQFKDPVMEYLMTRNIQLEKLSLHGANLLTTECWLKYLKEKGSTLTSLKVYATDKGFNDDVVASLATSCPRLARFKIDGNQELSSDGIKTIGNIKSLRHLSLRIQERITPKTLVHLVKSLGKNLETLSLRQVKEATDELLTAIKANCTQLKKLRIRDSEDMYDEGFVDLFTDWENGPLDIIDLESCRKMDALEPRSNSEKLGLCSDGFRALMTHSAKMIRELNVASCRHITKEAFEDVFSEHRVYRDLNWIDLSFCEEVDDYVVGRIFRSCPSLREVLVWGCMKVTSEHVIPPGVLLTGVPNALGVELGG